MQNNKNNGSKKKRGKKVEILFFIAIFAYYSF